MLRLYTVALRHGDWKVLADQSLKTFELYNVRTDFREKDNCAKTETQRLSELKYILTPLHAEIGREGPAWPAQKGVIR